MILITKIEIYAALLLLLVTPFRCWWPRLKTSTSFLKDFDLAADKAYVGTMGIIP